MIQQNTVTMTMNMPPNANQTKKVQPSKNAAVANDGSQTKNSYHPSKTPGQTSVAIGRSHADMATTNSYHPPNKPAPWAGNAGVISTTVGGRPLQYQTYPVPDNRTMAQPSANQFVQPYSNQSYKTYHATANQHASRVAQPVVANYSMNPNIFRFTVPAHMEPYNIVYTRVAQRQQVQTHAPRANYHTVQNMKQGGVASHPASRHAVAYQPSDSTSNGPSQNHSYRKKPSRVEAMDVLNVPDDLMVRVKKNGSLFSQLSEFWEQSDGENLTHWDNPNLKNDSCPPRNQSRGQSSQKEQDQILQQQRPTSALLEDLVEWDPRFWEYNEGKFGSKDPTQNLEFLPPISCQMIRIAKPVPQTPPPRSPRPVRTSTIKKNQKIPGVSETSVRVGSKYQATIPPLSKFSRAAKSINAKRKKDEDAEPRGDEMIWDPVLAQRAIDRGEDIEGFLSNGSEFNAKIFLMQALHRTGYRVQDAIGAFVRLYRSCPEPSIQLGLDDHFQANKMFISTQKNFSKISQVMNKSRTAVLVQYYRWKGSHTVEYCKLKRQLRSESDWCTICDDGGQLIVCDLCQRGFHLKCLRPPLEQIPKGDWFCEKCMKSPARMRRFPSKNPPTHQSHMYMSYSPGSTVTNYSKSNDSHLSGTKRGLNFDEPLSGKKRRSNSENKPGGKKRATKEQINFSPAKRPALEAGKKESGCKSNGELPEGMYCSI